MKVFRREDHALRDGADAHFRGFRWQCGGTRGVGGYRFVLARGRNHTVSSTTT